MQISSGINFASWAITTIVYGFSLRINIFEISMRSVGESLQYNAPFLARRVGATQSNMSKASFDSADQI